MSVVDSDADSISDTSNAHICDDDDGAEDSSISNAIRVLCNRLRENDPRVLDCTSCFIPFQREREYSESERIEVFQALKQNTSVKHIRLWLDGDTKRSAKVAAKCLESSQNLQTIELLYGGYYRELPAEFNLLLRALCRNMSMTKLIINIDAVRFDFVAFQQFLTSTQTLQTMSLIRYQLYQDGELNEVDIAAIKSGFASNKRLRDLEFQG
jgi:hypothetical protein